MSPVYHLSFVLLLCCDLLLTQKMGPRPTCSKTDIEGLCYLSAKYPFEIARNNCREIGPGWGLLDSQHTETCTRKLLEGNQLQDAGVDVTKQTYPNWTTVDGDKANDNFVEIENGGSLKCAVISINTNNKLLAVECIPSIRNVGYICEFTNECPLRKQCLRISRRNFLLDYNTSVTSWASARLQCMNLGADLAVIRSTVNLKKIIEYVNNKMENGGSGLFFTGVYQEKWEKQGNGMGQLNEKWAEGQPKSGNCVIQTTLGWESCICDDVKPTVCQHSDLFQLCKQSSSNIKATNRPSTSSSFQKRGFPGTQAQLSHLTSVTFAILALLCLLVIVSIVGAGASCWILQKRSINQQTHDGSRTAEEAEKDPCLAKTQI